MEVALTRALAGAALALLGSAAAASAAPPRTARLVSGGVVDADAAPVCISADGTRTVFSTTEGLVPGDPPGSLDLYARDADGGLQRITLKGWAGPGTCLLSRDGAYTWFVTARRELPDDVDGAADVYEVGRDGGRRLVSAGTATAGLAGATGDGAHVLFWIDEPLPGTGDVDAVIDIYDRRRDGSFRLATPGTAASILVLPDGVARDGGTLRFSTTEALVPEDVDGISDHYGVAIGGGPYRLLTAPDAGETSQVAADDAGLLAFVTAQPLVAADRDTSDDIYLRSPDGALRLVSGGSADTPVQPLMISRSGVRIVFRSTERLLPADADDTADVYLWAADGPLRLLTSAVAGEPDLTRIWLGDDGAFVVATASPLVPADGDATTDLYALAADAGPRLLTPGTPGHAFAFFGSGLRAAPRTGIDLVVDLPGDANGVSDAYEVGPEGLRPLAPGLPGGTTSTLLGAADGSRLLFTTSTTVPGTGDADAAQDVYEADVAPPSLAHAPTLSGAGRVGAPLTCSAPAVVGELVSMSRAWLRGGAAIAGATGASYAPRRADAGHDLACRVTATNPLGAAARTSAARRIAPAARASALAGVPVVGTRLVCTAFDGAMSVVYRWTRAGRVVVGRTGPRYRVGAADLGRRVACRATARSGQATSVVVLGRVVPRRCAVPSLRGALPGVAVARLGAAGCRSRVVRRRGKGVPVGRVLGTTPRAGVRRANGAVIVVRVRR